MHRDDNLGDAVCERLVGSVAMDIRCDGRLVWVVDAGEVRQLAE